MTALLLAALIATPQTYDVSLVKCHDADTCTFNFHLGMGVVLDSQSVRLCSINAPEVRGVEKERGIKSRDILMSWLTAAKKIVVQIPQKTRCDIGLCDKKDKYGRWLGYIIADGININDRLVFTGYAEQYHITCD